MSLGAIAAAQAYQRRNEFNEQQRKMESELDAYEKRLEEERKRQEKKAKLGGLFQALGGAALGATGIFTGNPMLMGAGGGMLMGGIGGMAGSPEMQLLAPQVGGMIGSGIQHSQFQDAMKNMSQPTVAQMTQQQAAQVSPFGSLMNYPMNPAPSYGGGYGMRLQQSPFMRTGRGPYG